MHVIFCRWALAALAVLAVFCSSTTSAVAQTVPAGFSASAVVPAGSLPTATAMQFAPDGRLFVCQQSGELRVIENGALLSAPFVDLVVDASGERGLLGVAFHPDFATNQWVYVYYTVPASGPTAAHNRISRFTANGNVAVPGSEVVIMDLDALSGGGLFHNGGAIDFGPDGKLYAAVGDDLVPANSQSLSTRHGKMLRINDDGSIPVDNPTTFAGVAGTPSGLNRAIWAIGLRNPFTFAQDPGGSPAMVINDVGQGTWEELSAGAAGANYGWPATEGDFDPASFPDFTRPRYVYRHGTGTFGDCAITGGAFYRPAVPTFPAEYLGTYFFADHCAGWIKRVDASVQLPYPMLTTAADFATGTSYPVDLKVGPDGNLYYLSRGNSTVFRIAYTTAVPTITSHPADVVVAPGASASFTVGAAGTAPLSYRWQRNGVDIAGAAGAAATYTLPSAQSGDSGARFRVRVSNSADSVYSNEAVLTVLANAAPVATIVTPTVDARYTGGMTLAFAGSGTDPDGAPTTLPPEAFSWRIDFHHDTHSHPFLPTTTGVASGTVVIPTVGETSANVWYRIHLTVTDAVGLTHSVYRDVLPQTVRLTLDTAPTGLQLTLDGQPLTAPVSFDSVVGVVRTIGAAAHTVSGTAYVLAGWSDGGAAQRAIDTPPLATTYTATFRAAGVSAPPGMPTGLAAVVNGATVHLSWSRAAGAQAYRLEAGTASGLADLVDANVGDVTWLEGLVVPGVYFARVRAVNAVGTSAPSPEVPITVSTTAACVAPPPPPGNFTAQMAGLLAAFAWTASPGASTYLLEAGTTSGATSFASLDLGHTTTFETTAPAGTYFTRVRAANLCGVSAPSAELPVALACTAGSVVPSGLSVAVAGGVATFSWTPPLGATGYRLQAGTAPGAMNLADIAVGGATVVPVDLAGVPPGTYYVRVVAESACGPGAPSNEVTVSVP